MLSSKASNTCNLTNKAETENRAERGKVMVTVATSRDVLMGRSYNSHPGNIQFREMIRRKSHQYSTSHDNSEKHVVAVCLLGDFIQQGGRFLRKVNDVAECPNSKKDGLWEVADYSVALNKVKQTFRDVILADRNRKESRKSSEQIHPSHPTVRALTYQSYFQLARSQLSDELSVQTSPFSNQMNYNLINSRDVGESVPQTRSEEQYDQLVTLLDKQQTILSSELLERSSPDTSSDQLDMSSKSCPENWFKPPNDLPANDMTRNLGIPPVAVASRPLGTMPSAVVTPVATAGGLIECQPRRWTICGRIPLNSTSNELGLQTSSPTTHGFESICQQYSSRKASRSVSTRRFDSDSVLTHQMKDSSSSNEVISSISFNEDTPLPSQLPQDMQKQLIDLFLPNSNNR